MTIGEISLGRVGSIMPAPGDEDARAPPRVTNVLDEAHYCIMSRAYGLLGFLASWVGL